MTQSNTANTSANGKAAPKPQTSIEKAGAAASKAIDKTLDGARDVADRTARAVDANPLPILAGGLAIGALAGALIPRSKREIDLLAPVGRKMKATATGAVSSARETGLAELGALGLSKGALNDQAGKLVGGILTALVTAGSAALTASKDANKTAD